MTFDSWWETNVSYSKKKFWQNRPYAKCPDCPKEYQVINCFRRHVEDEHGYSNEKAKQIIAEAFAKVGVSLIDCATGKTIIVSPKERKK